MPIRQDPEGRWHAEACVRRRRLHRRLPKGSTARDAKRVEAELVQALHAQTQAVVTPGDPSLSALLADYTDRHTKTLRSPQTARYHALRIARWVEGYRASQARQVAAAIVADMTGHYAPGTINRSLSALRKALHIAYETGLTQVNYGDMVKAIPEHNIRTVTLTLEQVRALADAASEQVRAAIWVSVYTGCRRGEIVGIKAEDISDDAITLRTGATKTMRHRSIPIIAPLRPWLQFLPLQITARGIESGFELARAAAGMPWAHFHDLRRSTATMMLAAGVDLIVIAKLLGHSSVRVTEARYAHLQLDRVRDGLEAAFTPALRQRHRRS